MKLLSNFAFGVLFLLSLSFSYEGFATEMRSSSFEDAQCEGYSDLTSLSTADNNFYHILKSCDIQNGTISLQDKSKIAIDWWYQSNLKLWNSGDRLKIYYDDIYNEFKIENVESNSICWGVFKSISNSDSITSIYKLKNTTDDSNAVSLKSGFNFEGPRDEGSPFAFWRRGDIIFVLHDTDDYYLLWNRSQKNVMRHCIFISPESSDEMPES